MTEADWQETIIDVARTLHWRVAHFRAARTVHGWRTPVSADGKGFPDLCLTRDRIIFVELKADAGKLSDEQEEWQHRLCAAGAETYIWRPGDDWEAICDILRRRRPA